jgi:hypothetical protein
MRSKITYFYLPIRYSMIDSRNQHFELEGASDLIQTEELGSTYSDDARDYQRIEGTNIYRAIIPGGEPSNFFIKVLKESDPLFNFDLAYFVISDDESLYVSDLVRLKNDLVPVFVDSKVLRLER